MTSISVRLRPVEPGRHVEGQLGLLGQGGEDGQHHQAAVAEHARAGPHLAEVPAEGDVDGHQGARSLAMSVAGSAAARPRSACAARRPRPAPASSSTSAPPAPGPPAARHPRPGAGRRPRGDWRPWRRGSRRTAATGETSTDPLEPAVEHLGVRSSSLRAWPTGTDSRLTSDWSRLDSWGRAHSSPTAPKAKLPRRPGGGAWTPCARVRRQARSRRTPPGRGGVALLVAASFSLFGHGRSPRFRQPDEADRSRAECAGTRSPCGWLLPAPPEHGARPWRGTWRHPPAARGTPGRP